MICLLCLVEAFAGEGSAVAVADLHPVPVVEICGAHVLDQCGDARACKVIITVRRTRIVGGAAAHDAAEGDLLLHEVRRAAAARLAELAGPHVVAPPASLHAFYIT